MADTENSTTTEVDSTSFAGFHKNLKDYFKSSKYSDLLIRCEDRAFQVHKVVVCGHSSSISKACDGEWKEGKEGVIIFDEESARAVEAMLTFMYTFDYDASGTEADRISPLLFNVEVYSLADMHDVQALKTRAKDKFEKAVKTCWEMDDFPHAVRAVYSSTPAPDRGLRDVVVEVSNRHIGTLLQREEFQRTLEETAGFAADLSKVMANGSVPEYRCPNCGRQWRAIIPSNGECHCMECGSCRSTWDQYIVG